MNKIKYKKLDSLIKYLPKSKIKAGEGKEKGKYPFYTSSKELTKYVDVAIYDKESIIFGTGGNASIHYCNKPFSTSTDCFVITKSDKNIDLKYIYYYLKSNIHILEAGFKGAGLKHISKKYISNIKIPILPLEYQKKVSALLTKIEELIQKRKDSIKLLDELIKSTFLNMFISNIENTKWNQVIISDLALQHKGSMRTGPFGSDLLHSEFNEFGDVAVIGIDNAVKNKFLWTKKRFITLEKYKKLKRYTLYPNDIIITIMGTVGRTAVIPDNIPLSINTKHLVAITPNLELINPYYLAYSLREDPLVLKQIKSKTKGALMDGLNLTIIKNLKIKLPPKPLQDKFASIMTKIEDTKKLYQKSLNELNNLFYSIAQKAFKGKLNLESLETKKETKKEALMLTKEKILELIKQGNFEIEKYINEHQSYDDIRNMIIGTKDKKGLIDEGLVEQIFDEKLKKMVLKVKQ